MIGNVRRILLLALLTVLLSAVVLPVSALQPKLVKADSVTLSRAKHTLYYGTAGGEGSLQLKYTILPTTADAIKNASMIEWTSSNQNVASVSKTGLVKPVGLGSCTIKLSLLDGSGKKASCKITVSKRVPTSVALNVTGATVIPGRRLQLKATVLPATAMNRDVSWKSTNKKVATVTKDGLVQAIKPGKTSIVCTAKSGGQKAYSTIRVGYDFSKVNFRFYGIVNTEYPSLIGSLPYYEENAQDVYEAYCGMMDDDLATLVQISEQRTGNQIRDILKKMVDNRHTTSEDITVFYYAGLGAKSDVPGDRGAIVGVDGDYGKGLITIEELQKSLDKIPGTIILILDCNQAGQYIKSKGVGSERAAMDALQFNLDVIRQFSKSTATNYVQSKAIGGNLRSKYKILTACGAKQNSYGSWSEDDDEGYAYFSKWLVNGLEGRADKDKDGVINLREMYNYTKAKVNAEVKKANKKLKKKRTQTVSVWPANDYTPLFVVGDGEE